MRASPSGEGLVEERGRWHDGARPRREGTAVRGISTSRERVLGHARRLLAGAFQSGRRSAVLGTILLIGSTVSVVATANTPPVITSLTVTPSVLNEGQAVTLTGAFTDPD